MHFLQWWPMRKSILYCTIIFCINNILAIFKFSSILRDGSDIHRFPVLW